MTQAKTITLDPGQSQEVVFTFTPDVAKVYYVSVDGLSGSFQAIEAPLVFDPWVYDTNNDGYVEHNEKLKAVQDYFAGIITYEQLNQVVALPEPPPPPPYCNKAAFDAAYGSKVGDPNYNPIFDFNGDGEIDIYDFTTFADICGEYV